MKTPAVEPKVSNNDQAQAHGAAMLVGALEVVLVRLLGGPFGSVQLQIANGRIVHIRAERTYKPEELAQVFEARP